ncbi:MAG: hypothetical protein A2086_00600 [Spirochaetes bacterium GWD1_27_9]|nr:MAG: hypothetical protein A2Z98_05110 [Spirochaetes bacterium GWB1_27_13]OHD25038.1 MAG: hypothetical protein A2Y34_03165 [Spirochaetes bacterium GWC1_27_15]OHD32509.1 MAG: hypothetical protein A2086_00600 [Spirochaetes bacterium GWD1_27_9]
MVRGEYYSFILHKNFNEWISESYSAVEEKNLLKFEALDSLITDYFSKLVIELNNTKIEEFVSLILEFHSFFFWGDKAKFEDVVSIVNGWDAFAKIGIIIKDVYKTSDLVKTIKKSQLNIKILQLLYNNNNIQSKMLSDLLNIEQNQLCNLTKELEDYLLIGREKFSKNSFYFLKPKGKKIYEEYFYEKNSLVELVYFILSIIKENKVNDNDIKKIVEKISNIKNIGENDKKKFFELLNKNKSLEEEKYSQNKEKIAKKSNFEEDFTKNGNSW